ncbi:MAG: type IX secretion system membrane protein PorP/SprF [Sphingobacteriales bacterium]|nr:MAG: type IX secretion system membrane protein PorP/SprF [Sphingobacteriales bacterium]
MKKRAVFIFLISISFFPYNSFAQYINIRQWQANYAFTNPAFTGISNSPRICADYEQIFPKFNPGTRIYELHYDQRISPKTGFIGVSYMYDVAGPVQTRQSAGLHYAYSFKLNEKMTLRAGASASFVHADIDTSKVISATKEDFPTNMNGGFFGFGTVLTYKNIFAGLSAFNYSGDFRTKKANGNNTFTGNFSLQTGGFFPVNNSNPKSTVIAPHIMIIGVPRNILVVPGVNVNKGIFTGGLSYRLYTYGDGLAFLAGVSKGWVKAGYTCDFLFTDARSAFSGSHQLSLTIYPGRISEENKTGLPYYFRKMGF